MSDPTESELREIDARVAEKISPWPSENVPHYSSSIADAFEMETAIKSWELDHEYSVLLAMEVWGDRGWEDWRDSWALAHATPLQRCQAALKCVGGE